jgi:hypothetical protein
MCFSMKVVVKKKVPITVTVTLLRAAVGSESALVIRLPEYLPWFKAGSVPATFK